MNSSELLIVATTVVDRISAKFDKLIRPPKKGRKHCNRPEDALENLGVLTKEDFDQYRDYLGLPHLVELIDGNLVKELPQKRYMLIKDWCNFTDWIAILTSLYCIVRVTKPISVVETGIGEIGMTSTFILRGLEDNRQGKLYSIDTDKFYPIYGYHVGRGIPDFLKHRHKVVVGSSQKELIPLLKDIGPIDIFLHDGDHKYRTKYFEYETSYSFLKKNGFIISDDSWDSSFDKFVSKHDMKNCSLKYGKGDSFSLARKQN